MTDKEIIIRIKRIKPTKISDFHGGKMAYRYLSGGAFRAVYTLSKNLVIKFAESSNSIEHSQTEILYIRRIKKLKKFSYLRRFIPKIYYMDYRHGVIVMERVNFIKGHHQRDRLREFLDSQFDKRSIQINDLHDYNFGKNTQGRLKILDLGCAT